MLTSTVTETRRVSPHTVALTPAQIKAQRRSQSLTAYELKQNLHESQVYSDDPCGGLPHRY